MNRFAAKAISLILVLLLVSSAFINSGAALGETLADATGLTSYGIRYRSQSDISAYLKAHPFSTTEAVTFSSSPSVTYPYSLGAISQASKNNGINALDSYRYVAGLSEVVWDSSLDSKLQSAALVSALNGNINHYPSKPALLDEATYNTGYEYCGKSNLYWNSKNLAYGVAGYVEDDDSSNISRVGHRRWCLNPSMGKTCFGFVYDENGSTFSAMYAFDSSNTADSGITNVAWPAQNTPVEMFRSNVPWSLSVGKTLDASNVKVRVTRASDSKTWNFSSTSSDGYFNVDNGGYGLKGCVVFRPDGITVSSGDSYSVRVETGENTVEYTVNFFSAGSPGGGSDPGTQDPGTQDPGTQDPGTQDPGTQDPGSEEGGFNFGAFISWLLRVLSYIIWFFRLIISFIF
ncbi:MAG: hypothetical protein IKH13_03360 [Clostridia bacterium]|nr:hypothetical protein [Clostridia bacterium]